MCKIKGIKCPPGEKGQSKQQWCLLGKNRRRGLRPSPAAEHYLSYASIGSNRTATIFVLLQTGQDGLGWCGLVGLLTPAQTSLPAPHGMGDNLPLESRWSHKVPGAVSPTLLPACSSRNSAAVSSGF